MRRGQAGRLGDQPKNSREVVALLHHPPTADGPGVPERVLVGGRHRYRSVLARTGLERSVVQQATPWRITDAT